MKYIKNQFIKSSQENSEVINFLFAPKFSYEYKGDNLDDFDKYFTDDVLNIEDVNPSLVSIVDKFLSSNTIKLEDKLAEQVSEISVSWNKEDFNLVVSCELSAGVIAEEILPELKEVIIEQVAKNIDSEEVEKQDIFAIKSDDLVEFFSDKGDAEKRAEEIESEDYEVVEGEVTILVSFDELKSAVVNEKAITSSCKPVKSGKFTLPKEYKPFSVWIKHDGYDIDELCDFANIPEFEAMTLDEYTTIRDSWLQYTEQNKLPLNNSKKIIKSAKVSKNISLGNNTKKLLDKLEKKVGHNIESSLVTLIEYLNDSDLTDENCQKFYEYLKRRGIHKGKSEEYLWTSLLNEWIDDNKIPHDSLYKDKWKPLSESSKQIQSGKYLEFPTDLAQEVAKFFDYKMPSRKQVADYMSDKFGTRKDTYSSNDFVDTLDSVMIELPYHCEDMTSSKKIQSGRKQKFDKIIEDELGYYDNGTGQYYAGSIPQELNDKTKQKIREIADRCGVDVTFEDNYFECYSSRKIQSNTVTSTLPPALDTFLKDLAQMKGLFDYGDITDFSKRATNNDLKELKKLRQQANEAAEYDDEEDLERIAKNVSKIILKSSKMIESALTQKQKQGVRFNFITPKNYISVYE